MIWARIFNIALFIVSVIVVLAGSDHILIDNRTYLISLLIYLAFSTLYFQLRVIGKSGNITYDYAISYSLSIVLFAGPIGLLLFETLYRFIIYFQRKITKTADEEEFYDTFYNIGAFVLSNSIGFYLFQFLMPYVEDVPFGFWLLLFVLVRVITLISDTCLVIVLKIYGEIKTRADAANFYKNRSILDMGKTALTNGLLLIILLDGNWETVISLFILNYIVSRSFVFKSQSIQDKLERDKFEQMAYTDFLTGVSNRALMDKKIEELNVTEECIGIIVADIDKFKSINDTYNHAIGDQVIQHFANTLKHCIQEEDYLFRSGGEEFTVFLRNRNFEQCEAVVEGMIGRLSSSYVNAEYKGENVEIQYTSSFGLYFFKVNEAVTLEKGYIYADQLLLQSKELGRNRLSAENGIFAITV
ncbi:GGDEF domain-containing protein [Bacillus suaedaesalsae]|uniref:GGDEF domain-containing protein n=1 Tax=Bacillus suaedaesalsae TaxID=2810349 RepID=A0ABS2DEJ0_9BACI|nr:GGDEF domain-containing protein [Bacillus suaedaesalsae]MBM6616880.1 GGDEF domain-containing protein [Bacillus suaedaesalsae]